MVNMSEKDISTYCKIPIGFVIKHDQRMPFDVFLRLSDSNVVKLGNKNDLDDMIQRYHDKGVREVLVNRNDFEKILNVFEQSLTEKFLNNSRKMCLEDLIDTIEDAYEILKEGLIKLGVREITVNIAKKTAIAGLEFMSKVPSVFKLFHDFEKRNTLQFLHSISVGYTASCMVDTFSWCSNEIKEEMSLASMLSDILLEEDDVKLLNGWERGELTMGELSDRILDHTNKTVQMLESSSNVIFSDEVITIIKQHHERPDGTGFPGSLSDSKVDLLSCIHIVAYNFILLMNQYDFDVEKKEDILRNLQNRFDVGNYEQAYNALVKMFND